MNKLKTVLTALGHKEPDVVPCFEFFSDDNAKAQFVPSFEIVDPLERAVAYAEFMGNCMVSVGAGGLRAQTVEQGDGYYIQEWENGARWRIATEPQWWREYVHYPLRDIADVNTIDWPDPDDPTRFEGVAEKTRYLSERGYFTQAGINGFFAGVWYFWRPFEGFLIDLVEQPRRAHELIERVGEFNLSVARHLLDCGVHAITFPDDLGYNLGTFISPSMYKTFFYPWHRRLAELCHDYGAFVNMHSHGNLNAIMPLLYEAHIDILNPVGPSDGMELAQLKARYGDRMTLMGGVSKFIGRMSTSELGSHLRDVLRAGSPGGGFILHSEGGIPADMPTANVYLYLLLRRQLARLFGHR
jgi:uroporphyrinogen decarboxylase